MTIKQHSTYHLSFRYCTLQKLSQWFMLSTIILLIGGGVALLWTYQQGHQNGHATGDVSVVGPPTLAAATVDAIFTRLGSPMAGSGKLVEQASRQANIDDAFALGVWWTETNDGEAGVGLADRNPGSVRGSVGYPSAFDGYTIYPSYTDAITYWFNMLRNDYVGGRGLSTVYTIARPYVGTNNYPLWAAKVINLMYSYRGIAPPPPVDTATSTPAPTPAVDPSVVVAKRVQQYQQHKLTQLLLSRPDKSISLLPGQGQAQEPAQQYYLDIPQVNSTTAVLPGPVELATVLFGLLAALAIALYSIRLKADREPSQQDTRKGYPYYKPHEASSTFSASIVGEQYPGNAEGQFVPTMPRPQFNLPSLPLTPVVDLAPSTDDLPVLPDRVPVTSGSGIASQRRVTEALPRRVTLVPPQAAIRAAVTANAAGGGETRSGGLLSRYRESNSNH